MKTSYKERGIKFAKELAELFEGCDCLYDFKRAIRKYNSQHKIPLKYADGVSRIAIIRSDYVIKFDYDPDTRWGNCKSEAKLYKIAIEDGMDHLLAEPTLLKLNGLTCSVMPRIRGIDNYRWDWIDHCTEEEYAWLRWHIGDMHRGNVGYRKGVVCVIDYAATA